MPSHATSHLFSILPQTDANARYSRREGAIFHYLDMRQSACLFSLMSQIYLTYLMHYESCGLFLFQTFALGLDSLSSSGNILSLFKPSRVLDL